MMYPTFDGRTLHFVRRTLRRIKHANRVVVLGVLVTASVGVVVAAPVSAGAASPNDFLCYVGGANQTASAGTAYAVPLEVAIGTNAQCSTLDTTGSLSVTFSVTSAGNGPSVSFAGGTSTVTTSTGDASITPIANQVAGLVSVTATSPAAQGQSVTFTLQNGSGAPATITPGVASYESTAVDTAFPLPLSVTVDDASNSPVPYAEVTFDAPTSGASGTFSSNYTDSVTVTADANGVAVAPAFVANDVAGGYVVDAYVVGTSLISSFAMVNQVTSAMTVASVSPPLLNQGESDVAMTVTGSGFEDGASAGFSNPAIEITSTTVVNATTIDLRVNIPASVAAGAYNLTVTDPGELAATASDVLIVAPSVSLPAPTALPVSFSSRSASLSAAVKSRLSSYADQLLSGASLKVVGYAKGDAPLARSRALEVEAYLKTRVSGLRVTVVEVTSRAANEADVITVKND